MDLEIARRGFSRARDRRMTWEPLWSDCYAYAQPSRGHGLEMAPSAGRKGTTDLFDATAVDGVEQLAASLLAELTPPWSRWFGLMPGQDVADDDKDGLATSLESTANRIQSHLHRSNFAVEIHQCLLDLVTMGTATLLFEEAPSGDSSAFRFTAIPTSQMYIDGDDNGRIRRQFRKTCSTLDSLSERFPGACDWETLRATGAGGSERLDLIEAVTDEHCRSHYLAYVDGLPGAYPAASLATGSFVESPFLTFRWLKGTGEIYGRSPVMSALPDIKTANKVVELILKNASLAVTGIWLAEDDGVLNPANIRLIPGSIIPKAAGSSGLTPLQTPGRLDVSELVLNDLRSNIRHTLLTDRLAPLNSARMTATEVLERSAETTRLLGAIYGRLQAELLTPLLRRAVAILARRGEVPDLRLDGELVDLQYRSPLARVQASAETRSVLLWLETVGKLSSLGSEIVDVPKASRWLAEQLGVPSTLIADQSRIDTEILGRALEDVLG